MFFQTLLTLLSLNLLTLTLRILYLLRSPAAPSRPRKDSETCSLAVFLGSGGHTTEMLLMLSALPFDRYTPRMYFISSGDTLSLDKAFALEREKGGAGDFRFIRLPRAREVHQPLHTTPLSASLTLLSALRHFYPLSARPAADVLLLNGPGTGVVLVLAVWIAKVLVARKGWGDGWRGGKGVVRIDQDFRATASHRFKLVRAPHFRYTTEIQCRAARARCGHRRGT